jgi:hypothetical protein
LMSYVLPLPTDPDTHWLLVAVYSI